ncbi:hypothetical protein [Fictibacillus sp. KU28468]|nr:hypothetical protein [Fictibacillus sp. KU28468]UZJ79599.1 hypothetical protein OKX00_03715 [Fictibacillus sp. KU28468]
MTSYDKMKNGHTLLQKWGGEWDLVYEDGEWKLDQAHLEKRDSNVQ